MKVSHKIADTFSGQLATPARPFFPTATADRRMILETAASLLALGGVFVLYFFTKAPQPIEGTTADDSDA